MRAEPEAPDSTTVRVALWRAMHVLFDPSPRVSKMRSACSLRVAAPDDGWRRRPDMGPRVPSRARASIVARAHLIEDLVVEMRAAASASTSFSEPAWTSSPSGGLRSHPARGYFAVDRPGPQAWKRQRLMELDFGVPEWLRLVPLDFEAGGSW